MKQLLLIVQGLLVLALAFTAVSPVAAGGAQIEKKSASGYQTGFMLWRGSDGGFADWQPVNSQVSKDGGVLILGDGLTAAQDTLWTGRTYPYYNGGSYEVGEIYGPDVNAGFGFNEAIASWNAETPEGTWIETWIQARIGGRWTKWYSLGVWASGTGTVHRHSVNLQGDADGYVAVDTLALGKSKVAADALRLKVQLFRAAGITATPVVHSMSLAYSTSAVKKLAAVSPFTLTGGKELAYVPFCSQMVYPDGGEVWCSPTSTSMVLGYWGIDPGPCADRVAAAVAGVYDWVYDGHGNWPFNTAYAASRGLEGYVARYTGLQDLEPWIRQGVPVVMSIAWGKGDLDGAPIPSSSGHLVVLVGFDSQGNAIVHDPAFGSNDAVRVVYNRAQFETVWQTASGGTVYLIFPHGQGVW